MLAYVAALYDEVSTLLRHGRFEKFPAPGDMMAWQARGGPGSAQSAEGVLVVATGWGAEAAGTGAGWLVREVRPEAVVALGYSGGTRPGLRPGSLVIAEQTARLGVLAAKREAPPDANDPAHDGGEVQRPVSSDRGLLGLAHSSAQEMRIPVMAGLVGTTPQIVSSARRKASLGANTGVLAVDLETWHYGSAADGAGIPFLAVRAVVDTVDDDLPGFVERMAPGPRPAAAIPALRYLIGRPGGLRGVIQTGVAAGRARRALAQFVTAFSGRWFASPVAAPRVAGPRQ